MIGYVVVYLSSLGRALSVMAQGVLIGCVDNVC